MSYHTSKHLKELQALVDAQAENEGLWFDVQTASEAYLQAALRRLHQAIESPDKISELIAEEWESAP